MPTPIPIPVVLNMIMARCFITLLKRGLVDTEHSIQIGIRTAYDIDGHPFEVLDAAWVGDHGPGGYS